jgi:hypothetical protein
LVSQDYCKQYAQAILEKQMNQEKIPGIRKGSPISFGNCRIEKELFEITQSYEYSLLPAISGIKAEPQGIEEGKGHKNTIKKQSWNKIEKPIPRGLVLSDSFFCMHRFFLAI